ncbi:hypothetical protein U1Q18_024014 [Sarracenia purpurea var. burkii]
MVSSISLLLSFLLFVLMVVKYTKTTKSKSSTPKLPPGPWRLPLIGNMHQLVGSLPHHTVGNLAKKYGPLMHLQLGEVSTIVISSPEIAKEVLKTHDIIFAQRPSILAAKILTYDYKDIVFSPYGDYWKQMRKICAMELLSLKRVQTFRGIREEEVSNLVSSISANARLPINLSKEVSSMTYGIVSRAMFGRKCKDQDEFFSILKDATILASGFNIVDMFPSIKLLHVVSGTRQTLEKMHERIDQILQKIINEHRDNRQGITKNEKGEANEDLLDALLGIQKDNDFEFSFTDNNIKAVVLDVFTAGSDTSSTVVEWAMSELMKNPEIMKRAQFEVRQVFAKDGKVHESGLHELKYLNLVIKETLRLHPSSPFLSPRESSDQCVINEYEIPAKTKVLVSAWAIGRDSRYWNKPDKFNPERFLDNAIDFNGRDFKYIPFGAGRRICPGIFFALPNVELPLAQLLYHFDWKLPNGMKQEELDMEETLGMTMRRKHDLYLIPIPYDPHVVAKV